jgi:GDPmannose 4,6-dehydratase
MPSKALITGVTGQDGSYLAEFLLHKGYKVSGLVRRSSSLNLDRLSEVIDQIDLISGDLLDQNSLSAAIERSQPEEIYNLAAQSFVATSWQQADLTGQFTALGVSRLLEASRLANPQIRFYQASSSEMFGSTNPPQNESSPFHPRSPYAVAKVYGHYITQNYRESFGMFACSGILFNH